VQVTPRREREKKAMKGKGKQGGEYEKRRKKHKEAEKG